MPATPSSRPKATPAQWKAAALKIWKADGNKGPLPEAYVVVCPGYYLNSMGEVGRNDRGINDDAFYIHGIDIAAAFNGNADPSIHRSEIATLKPGQIVWYRPGPHGIGRPSEHEAFRQDSPVIVKRDNLVKPAGFVHKTRGVSLGDGYWTDANYPSRFWTNLHRQSWQSTSSEGCLTIPREQWEAFRETVYLAISRAKLKRFPAIILEGPFA